MGNKRFSRLFEEIETKGKSAEVQDFLKQSKIRSEVSDPFAEYHIRSKQGSKKVKKLSLYDQELENMLDRAFEKKKKKRRFFSLRKV